MERLTKTGEVFTFPKVDPTENAYLERVQKRLSAYEDRGYTPDEIDELALEIATLKTIEAMYDKLGPVDELSALVKARDEGRVMVLPCKPDEVYWEMLGDIPAVSRFDGICTIDENMNLFYQIEGDSVKAENIGKTVFLTRAEAAAALSGGGGDG